ncbi:MAG: SUF system NifU family Fe-S cluster assembly protein [Austwickia sp.]|nr:SUF system NifU family Fe-S cluster assembly protein [Austwickia sp.]MBK8435389.1 SUF system NifU family Fe-S cluster assembly protein [Austwickia sp.]MBK9101064.1 SUF system NifU family Fe-S cluster assembly protein [Austwickia sp.]
MDLYQELIIDHSKHPQHAGLREPYDAQVHHVNTSCGDEITLRVHLQHVTQGPLARLEDVSYDAIGCSISVASTSILAQECLGRPVQEVMATYEAMKGMLTSRGQDSGDEEVIGDGVALAGVAKYPARVKCALLGWAALTDALARAGADLGKAEETIPAEPAGPSSADHGVRR